MGIFGKGAKFPKDLGESTNTGERTGAKDAIMNEEELKNAHDLVERIGRGKTHGSIVLLERNADENSEEIKGIMQVMNMSKITLIESLFTAFNVDIKKFVLRAMFKD